MKRGFTLLEVMIALAILGLSLGVMIRSSASSIMAAEESHMMGVATDLARGKMLDVEERLLKEGFSDTDQSQTDWKPFDEEGWPNIQFKYDVIQVEFPNFDELQAIAQNKQVAAGSGSAFGSALGSGSSALGSALGSSFTGSADPLNTFQNSALGGMLGMMGMMGGGGQQNDIAGAQAASLIQSKYDMFQQILKVTVRKVKVYVKWTVLGHDRDMTVVAFFTDPASMDKVLNGMGSQDISGQSTGSGSGSGSNTRTTTGTGSGSGK